MTSGQTCAISSCLLTTSFGLDSSATRMSRLRAPSSTGAPSLVRSRSLATRLKGPNDTTSLTGVIVASSFGAA